ncbi:hypothetical protein [Tepidibacillus marianensis]|uniref:hypothetical protein n=1 Tax=Tepidibacillus marianensis TaxID=3131995 RepID=UPI0030D32CD3
MKKVCSCGMEMELTIRTLYLNRRLKIENVPVYSCPVCENHQLIGQTSSMIKDLIHEASHTNEKRKAVPFEKKSELAQLLMMAYHRQEISYDHDFIHEDVQDLLDELTMNGDVEETYWKKEIKRTIEKYVQ